jgi:hypothetical protein
LQLHVRHALHCLHAEGAERRWGQSRSRCRWWCYREGHAGTVLLQESGLEVGLFAFVSVNKAGEVRLTKQKKCSTCF